MYLLQKWGWGSSRPGDWLELKVNSLQQAHAGPGSDSSGEDGSMGSAGEPPPSYVMLSYLRSWQPMARALVKCLHTCSCEATVMDGHWNST